MKIQFRFSKLLDNNKFIFVLSVIITLIAWLAVGITGEDRQTAKISGIPMAVDLKGTTPERYGLQIIEGSSTPISVWVEGPRAEVNNLGSDAFTAVPQFNEVTSPGEYDIPIDVSLNVNGDYKITDYTATVKMIFDEVETREYEVIGIADKVKAKDGYRKDIVTASPRTVKLTGPKAELALIKEVRLEYAGDETAEATIITSDASLKLYGEDSVELTKLQIPHVTTPTQEYSLTIPIYMQKTIPVQLEFINNYGKLDESKLRLSLSAVSLSVAGPKEIVSEKESVSVGPVDFTKLDIGSAQSFPVTLDSGVINEDEIQQITVTFGGDGYDKKLLNVDGGDGGNILAQNIPADMDVEIQTQQIKNVKMVGLASDIELLSSEELIARVDLSTIEEGTTRVRAKIYVTGGKYAWAVGEYYVQVKATSRVTESQE